MNYTTTKLWLLNHIGTFTKGEEYDFLHLLIKNHPSYNEWQYNIPLKFKIVKKPNIQLMVCFQKRYRIVSWVRCCTNKTRKIDPLTSAMRHAIKRQISIYKNKNIEKICSVCQQDKKIEVDHYPIKFFKIKEDFMIHHIAPTNFQYHPKRGYSMFTKKDAMLKKSWQKYHLKTANYRYLCSTCNKKY